MIRPFDNKWLYHTFIITILYFFVWFCCNNIEGRIEYRRKNRMIKLWKQEKQKKIQNKEIKINNWRNKNIRT